MSIYVQPSGSVSRLRTPSGGWFVSGSLCIQKGFPYFVETPKFRCCFLNLHQQGKTHPHSIDPGFTSSLYDPVLVCFCCCPLRGHRIFPCLFYWRCPLNLPLWRFQNHPKLDPKGTRAKSHHRLLPEELGRAAARARLETRRDSQASHTDGFHVAPR